MSFYVLSLILTGISSVLLGAFIFLQGKNRPANITLGFYAFAVAVWCLAQAFGELTTDKSLVVFWLRFKLGGAVFIPAFYFAFVVSFLEELKQNKNSLILCFFLGAALLLLDLTPLFVLDVSKRSADHYYPVYGPAYYLFFLYFVAYIGAGFHKLIAAAGRSYGVRRNQIFYIVLASALGFGGGITAFLPAFNIGFPYLAHYFVPLYIVIAIYAIFRHQLLDIRFIIRGGLIYSIITAFFAGTYALLIYSLKELFQSFTGWNSIPAIVIMVFGAVVVFDPLQKRVQSWVDRLFFRKKYDYQKALRELSCAAVSIFDEKELLALVTRTVKDTMQVSLVSVLPAGEKPCGFELSLPFRAKGISFGTLNLGPKLSGEMYSEEDVNLLVTLSNQVAIALNNAALHKEVLLGEKLKALGTMAAGLAHEIRNPLASIKGMTQILPENISDPEFIIKYSDIVPRQLDRINSILENLLRIGRPRNFISINVDLSKIVSDLVKLIENQCLKKNIKVTAEIEDNVWVQGDADQLTQAFMNLVLNAMDAMPQGGELKVSCFRPKAGNDKEEVLVEVSDTGAGIAFEDKKRIFDPFFTTKEKGTGLGLTVTYRVIKEHKGEIEVESNSGGGTKFKVWLYTRQKE